MRHRMDVSRSCCGGGTIDVPAGLVLDANWTNYERGISGNVTISGAVGDRLISKWVFLPGAPLNGSGIAVRFAATDLPAGLSSATGRFVYFSGGSPEPDQDIEIYAVRVTGGSVYAVASFDGPVNWTMPATPEVGTYPPGTMVETPDVAGVLNAVTSGSWSGGDMLYLVFRSATTETFGTSSRLVKQLVPMFSLEWS